MALPVLDASREVVHRARVGLLARLIGAWRPRRLDVDGNDLRRVAVPSARSMSSHALVVERGHDGRRLMAAEDARAVLRERAGPLRPHALRHDRQRAARRRCRVAVVGRDGAVLDLGHRGRRVGAEPTVLAGRDERRAAEDDLRDAADLLGQRGSGMMDARCRRPRRRRRGRATRRAGCSRRPRASADAPGCSRAPVADRRTSRDSRSRAGRRRGR